MGLMHLRELTVSNRLAPLELDILSGELVGIIGPNGAGKSTLLSALAGVQRYHGSAALNGVELQRMSPALRARQLGYLPQSHSSAWQLRVEDVVALGRLPWADDNRAIIEHAMQRCEVSAWRRRPIAQLSGGEQARVWLARVLAGEPQVLIADEPIAALDLLHQRNILKLLREYASAERAVIFSLHDLSLAARFCDKLCLLKNGQLLAYGTPAEVLTEAHLQAAFSVKVHVDLSATPPLIQPE